MVEGERVVGSVCFGVYRKDDILRKG
ncbi:hypothetical protein THOM_3002 [Trachipleistophora hominis]|uniref:Uncharacterized protein n=1 Tax=Trachipleistophora hominis TaxID=72359 RepID=L7JST7_TRAHO|nr:hypothetical protein THOM_3002 [Trachipleistophora hominis]